MKKVNRRNFMKGLACISGAAAYATVPGGNILLPKDAQAQFRGNRRIGIIQADGGWDPQFFFLPPRTAQFDGFYDGRPSAGALYDNGLALNGTTARVSAPNTSLQTLWNSGEVAVACVARANQSRSHQQARERNALFQNKGWAANLGEASGLSSPFNYLNPSNLLNSRGAEQITGNLNQFGFNKSSDDAQLARTVAGIIGEQSGLTGSQANDYEGGLGQANNLEAQIAQALAVNPAVQNYPGTSIGRQLADWERLIATFPNTVKVLQGRRGGMDNHSNIVNAQTNNIPQIFDAILALKANLESRGEWNNMAIVVNSEFGRTYFENGNNGTDHGNGNIQFVIGGAVNGGIYNDLWDRDGDRNWFAAPNDTTELYSPIVQWAANVDPTVVFPGATISSPITGILS